MQNKMFNGEPRYHREMMNLRSSLYTCIIDDDSPLITSVEEHNVLVSIDLKTSFGFCLFEVMLMITPLTLSRLIGHQR